MASANYIHQSPTELLNGIDICAPVPKSNICSIYKDFKVYLPQELGAAECIFLVT